jgi:hypothetical protein
MPRPLHRLGRLIPHIKGFPALEAMVDRTTANMAYRSGYLLAAALRAFAPGVRTEGLLGAFEDGATDGSGLRTSEDNVLPFPGR